MGAYSPQWPPVSKPELTLSAPNTLILLASSATLWWGERGIRKGSRGSLVAGIVMTFVLGAVFLSIQIVEYHRTKFLPQSHAYGSMFYTITGFHSAHVAIGLLMLLFVLARSVLGHFTPRRHLAVKNVSMYWHFVGHRVVVRLHHDLHHPALLVAPMMNVSRAGSFTATPVCAGEAVRVSMRALWFGLGGAPIAWSIQEVVDGARVAQLLLGRLSSCRPRDRGAERHRGGRECHRHFGRPHGTRDGNPKLAHDAGANGRGCHPVTRSSTTGRAVALHGARRDCSEHAVSGWYRAADRSDRPGVSMCGAGEMSLTRALSM
ncbi:MAG: cytochrome c oxidase subunit 3 [Candidatus Elarobacter sp.]